MHLHIIYLSFVCLYFRPKRYALDTMYIFVVHTNTSDDRGRRYPPSASILAADDGTLRSRARLLTADDGTLRRRAVASIVHKGHVQRSYVHVIALPRTRTCLSYDPVTRTLIDVICNVIRSGSHLCHPVRTLPVTCSLTQPQLLYLSDLPPAPLLVPPAKNNFAAGPILHPRQSPPGNLQFVARPARSIDHACGCERES